MESGPPYSILLRLFLTHDPPIIRAQLCLRTGAVLVHQKRLCQGCVELRAVHAEVHGDAPQLVPGIEWSVTARSEAPVERFIPEPER